MSSSVCEANRGTPLSFPDKKNLSPLLTRYHATEVDFAMYPPLTARTRKARNRKVQFQNYPIKKGGYKKHPPRHCFCFMLPQRDLSAYTQIERSRCNAQSLKHPAHRGKGNRTFSAFQLANLRALHA